MNINKKEIFWTKDLTELYKNNKYLIFIPTGKMTFIEKLNALTRLCFYYTIIIILFQKKIEYYYISIIFISLIFLFYYGSKHYNKYDNKYDNKYNNKYYNKYNNRNINEYEVGYYDSNNNLHYTNTNNNTNNNNNNKVEYDRIKEYSEAKCRRPTNNNPFMNPLIIDYNNNKYNEVNDVGSCINNNNDEVNKEINDKFNKDLYRDIDDLFDKKNSQRQFYTVPNTMVPNDQTGFAKWCFGQQKTCKEDQENCLRYEDIRFKR